MLDTGIETLLTHLNGPFALSNVPRSHPVVVPGGVSLLLIEALLKDLLLDRERMGGVKSNSPLETSSFVSRRRK